MKDNNNNIQKILIQQSQVANTPKQTIKQHNMQTVWTPIPHTDLVLHSSFPPYTNINIDLCDGLFSFCTLLTF
jgi:hypothetical protein